MAVMFLANRSCYFTEAKSNYFYLWLSLNVENEEGKTSAEVATWTQILTIQVSAAIVATITAFAVLLWRWISVSKKAGEVSC